jgi:dTDP-4-dehydrorhamnose 3,5-epimerase
MIFRETKISGAYIIDLEPVSDARGFFARLWCRDEFREYGLQTNFVQANTTLSREKGTLRGLHYQVAPHAEAKLVRCIRGAVYDVAVDVRAGSDTFGNWTGVELTQNNRSMFYVPEGCAHGYLSLTDSAEASYLTTAVYSPATERGIRYDDPSFDIVWPSPVRVVSEKDQSWSDFEFDEDSV